MATSSDTSLSVSSSSHLISRTAILIGFIVLGGSTVILLFEKGVVELDEDLLVNGRASLETLVRVGMGLGRRKGVPQSLSQTGNEAISGAKNVVSGVREGARGMAEGMKGMASGLKGLASGTRT